MTRQEQIQQQAAAWLIRKDEPDWSEEHERQLHAWLEESAAHKAAFWRLEHGWRLADCDVADPAPRFRWTPTLIGLQAAAAAVLVLLGALWMFTGRPASVEMAKYSTGRGQTSSLRLADGTRVELNTDTTVRVPGSGEGREIWIDDGEAFFDVVHDPKHPFTVHAGARTITVLGTQFNVVQAPDRTAVGVVEGRVRVASQANSGTAGNVVVARGDLAFVTGSSTLIVSNALGRIEQRLGWRQGLIVLDQTPLSDAVKEFNRYSAVQLVVSDPALADIRIGGRFRTTEAEDFAKLLHTAYGVKVVRQSGKIDLRAN